MREQALTGIDCLHANQLSARTHPTSNCFCRTRCKSGCPKAILAHYIGDTVDTLDLSAFFKRYQGGGSRNQPFHPAMMVKVLVYGYATGVFSSRKIAKKLHEDVAFRVLACRQLPQAPHAQRLPGPASGRTGGAVRAGGQARR